MSDKINDKIYDTYDDTIKDDNYYTPPPIRLIKRQEQPEEQHDISKKLIEDCFIMNTYDEDTKFQITHTTIMKPRLSLYLARNNINKFYRDYNKIIKYNNTHEEQIFISITEKPPLYSMFCIDIDLQELLRLFQWRCLTPLGSLNEIGEDKSVEQPQNGLKTTTRNLNEVSLYDDNDIKQYITITNNTIRRLRPNINNKYLECIVLTKPPYIKNGKIKHGIHIQYINLFIHKDIRKLIQKISNIGDIIYNNNWLLYGSVKNEWTGTYKVYKIYGRSPVEHDHTLNEIPLLDFLDTYKIYDTNEVRFKPTVNQLSQILSIYPFNRECLEGFVNITYDTPIFSLRPVEQPEQNEVYDIVELRNICNNLRIEHSDNYKTWYIVGQSLYNITNGDNDGLELYKSFSSLSSKYNERETTTKYKRFNRVGTFNIDTLIRLIK